VIAPDLDNCCLACMASILRLQQKLRKRSPGSVSVRSAVPVVGGPEYSDGEISLAARSHLRQPRGISFSTIWSTVKLAAFCRGGNSLKLSSHSCTTACAAYWNGTCSPHHARNTPAALPVRVLFARVFHRTSPLGRRTY